ncbi:MAG: hypothetical protein H8E19_17385 [Deltaproteobacteria bacterium]|uniref:Uncharacterized protein n=1 Tax=Candidatus Desulfacyla euxinica TaxID=2841693 RepID=A0A8J6N1I6_9DELT|nr:hypothetical protein [Candidatus Desulfacyla euxinica]MBL7218398.1 hypothetical protein [Desulfobacteraceae bacterium]
MNAISIAAIHATILTILISFVSAYGIFKRTRIQEIENEIIDQAEKINLVKFEGSIYFPSNQMEDLNIKENIYQYADEIRDSIGVMPPGKPFEINDSGEIFFSSKEISLEEKSQEAKKALALMNIIFHYYPFPISYKKLKDKRGWDVESPTEYIYFQNVGDVKQWLTDIKRVIKAFNWVFTWLPYAKYNSESLLALNEVEKKKMQNIGPLPIDLRRITPSSILKNYVQGYHSVKTVIKDTEYNLKRFNRLKRDFPKCTFLLSISAIFLTFIIGVMLPMIKPNIDPFFLIWIPILFYIIAFGFIFIKILRG